MKLETVLSKQAFDLFWLSFIFCATMAQETGKLPPKAISVTGRLTDEKGNPPAGISVQLKNGQVAAISDQAGQYKASVSADATLVFTSVDYAAHEVAVNGRGVLDLVLKTHTTALDHVVVIGYGTQKKVNQKYCKKWTDAGAPINGGNSLANNNFMVYRYADLLLMLCEATGDAKYLNEVRARVSLPLFGSPSCPSAQYGSLTLAIEHERRMELAIEFHRWFDLKRTNRAVTVLGAKGKNINADKLLLPIPAIVRTQNDKITQNNGYN